MAILLSLSELADTSLEQECRERGIPVNVPLNVARILYGQHPKKNLILVGMEAAERRREIRKGNQLERVLRTLAGRNVQKAMEDAPRWLAEAAKKNWGDFWTKRLLTEERPVVWQLWVAFLEKSKKGAAPLPQGITVEELEGAFRDHGFLTTNEHATLHNLFRRAAIRKLQADERAGVPVRRGRDDREEAEELLRVPPLRDDEDDETQPGPDDSATRGAKRKAA